MNREEQKAYNAENYPASVLKWLNEATDRAYDSLDKAKLEHKKLNDARFWRIYYIIQEILAKHLIHLYEDNSDGGIRQQSTLPPKLNKDVMSIAKELYRNKEIFEGDEIWISQ